MASRKTQLVLVLIVLIFFGVPADGKIIPVREGESIQAAVDKASPGDTVLIACGMYIENVRVTRSGTADAPIIIEGEEGAEIHGYTNWQPKWTPASFGEGIFKTPRAAEPGLLCYNGLYVLKCTKNQKRILAHGSETEQAKTPGGFKHIRAVWAYMDGQLYLRTPDKEDPGAAEVYVAQEGSACIFLDGASNVIVRGLTLRYATYGVLATNCTNVVVEHCTVGPTDHGIRFWQNVHDSKIRYCQVTCPAIFEWVRRGPPETDGTKHNEDIYYINKTAGPQNRRSISLLNSGHNNEIAYNHIHDCYQGIEAKEDRTEDGHLNNQNLNVHHNYIHETAYYALSPNGTDINGRWHHNLLVNNTSSAIRIKPPSAVGPLYIYRNVIRHEGGRVWWASDAQKGPVLMYHNTFYGGWTMIRLASGRSPGVCLIANAFIGPTRAYRHGHFIGRIPPDQIDYNLITNRQMELYDELQAGGYQKHDLVAPLGLDSDRADIVALTADTGPNWKELTAALRVRYPALPAQLPGTEHVKGRADIGAYEDGALDGEHEVGVDPALCGARAYHNRNQTKQEGQVK